MRVDELIAQLQKERPDEEVVCILGEDTTNYHMIDERPLLHAGPSRFVDKNNKFYRKSVVIIRLKKK